MQADTEAANGLEIIANGGVTSAQGFSAGAVPAKVRSDWDKPDVALLYSEARCAAAAVYTQCRLAAASVAITRKHLADGGARAVVANSGCANAATGEQGLRDAVEMACLAGEKLGIDPYDVVVASTGVIGVLMPMDRIREGIAGVQHSPAGGADFAHGIMTTDTKPKQSAVRFGDYTLGGACKGAGMIHPNMATMLAFLTTDAPVSSELLWKALKQAVDVSFNMIDVDSDTSTNDMVVALANGAAGGEEIAGGNALAPQLVAALTHVCTDLARQIVADAEGGTKVIEATVMGAASEHDARAAAREIVRSMAVKTAVYGRDPNWGRVLAAVGNADCAFEELKASVWLVDDGRELCLLKRGAPQPFDRDEAVSYLEPQEVCLRVDLGLGDARAVAWGSDITEEYVRVNSQYTT